MENNQISLDLGVPEVIPKRPVWNDNLQKELVLEIAKTLKDHEEFGGFKGNLEKLSEFIYDSIETKESREGYDICKDLEDNLMISPDDEMVEILGSTSHLSYDILTNEIKRWVKTFNLKPKYQVGEFKKFKSIYQPKNTVVEGEIMSIREETLEYGMFFEGLGTRGRIQRIIKEEDLFTEEVQD